MKKAFKITGTTIGILVLVPVVLFVIIIALLYYPPFQNWAVKQVASYASDATGMEITVERVGLDFPLNLELEGVKALRQNDSIPTTMDTVADVKNTIVHVQLWPLLRSQVEVDVLELQSAKINTVDFIGAAQVKGTAGKLSLASHGINLSGQSVHLNSVELHDANLDVQLSDTVPEDTTKTETLWKIALDKAQVMRTNVTVHMPGDTLQVQVYLGDTGVKGGRFDLYKSIYEIAAFDWKDGKVSYDNNYTPRLKSGFDYNHICLDGVSVGIDSLKYNDPELTLNIRSVTAHEQSGLNITRLSGRVYMDSLYMSLQNVNLATPYSTILGGVNMDFDAFDEVHPGKIYAKANASIGRSDLLLFAKEYMPKQLVNSWPLSPLDANIVAQGNMQRLDISTCNVGIPSVFNASVSGFAAQLTDMDKLRAELKLDATTYNMSMFTAFLDKDTRKMVSIPSGIVAHGDVLVAGPAYDTQMKLSQGGGYANVLAHFNSKAMNYTAKVSAHQLPVQKFLPKMGLSPFSGDVSVNGSGTDPYRKMQLTADARIDRFAYDGIDISGTRCSARVNNGMANANVDIVNKMIKGTAGVTVNLNARDMFASMRYNADLQANQLPVQKFLPGMGLTPFSGHVRADGYGVDPYGDMMVTADADIDYFRYTDFDLSGSTAQVQLGHGKVEATANLHNKKIGGTISVGALLKSDDLRATIGCDLAYADLYALKLVEVPLQTSLCAHVDVASDLDEYYMVQGVVNDVVIVDSAHTYHPDELVMDVLTHRDTTWAKVNTGDFHLDMAASGGYKQLMQVASNLTSELTRQIDRRYIDQDSLKMVLPEGHFLVSSGQNNFLFRYADGMGYQFHKLKADFKTSPATGINGTATVDSLAISGMQFDAIKLTAETDEHGFKFNGKVQNYKDNPDICFKGLFEGTLFETGANVDLAIYDSEDKLGIKTGLKAMLEADGIRVQMSDVNSVLGYRKFTANKDNYVFLGNDNRVSAYLMMKDDSGTGVHIYSDDDNTEALQDITIGVNHLDLTSIVALLPYFPSVTGVLDGDFHVIQTESELSVSSSLGIDKLVYEGTSMGDVATEFVYIPKEDGSHYVDGILIHNDDEVGTIKGTYSTEGDGYLDTKFRMSRLPLNMVNGFIPDQIIGLKGYGDGSVDIKGPLSNLDVDGKVNLDSAYMSSQAYGVELRFDNRPVRIQNSRLLLDNFYMYSHNNQPLTINGYVDFANVSRMSANMNMSAKNFLLIDSKQNRKSEVFGKMYVNANAMINGPLEALQMRGKLDVLGNTDMTYILRDSPLTNDNRLEGLVTFTDLDDDDDTMVAQPPVGGMYMDFQIGIAQGAHIVCALNAEKSNYIDLFGGGDLRMTYSDEEMRLTGRYTLTSGEMKYSLPVIPLQTFTIQDGSYVEFTGEVMNPTLNITATETIKSMVNADGVNRNVEFNTGVVITKTLNDMGLEFIIDAPEDMNIHGQLQTMSVEERGKLAVTMLTTGMYLADNNMSSFTMNSALSSFLQSEINSITGNALRTLDLSIGLDNSTDATGALHTDYSFKFAKRFWNNRIKLVVGGKVSPTDALDQSLFDNIALEYRLDQSANTNLKLFYDRAVYDYLEGYVGEYGVGLVWKRKLQNFSDIFRLKPSSVLSNPKPSPMGLPGNSPLGITPIYVNPDSVPPLKSAE